MALDKTSGLYENASVGSSFDLSLTGVAANATVLVAVVVKVVVGSGELVSGATASGCTFSIAASRVRTCDDNVTARFGVYLLLANAVTAGDKTITVNLVVGSGNIVNAQAISWNGLAASALDKIATGEITTAGTAVAAGPTAAISQGDEVLFSIVGGKWWWSINHDGLGDHNRMPSGWTKIGGGDTGAASYFVWGHKTVASPGSTQSISHAVTAGEGDGGITVLATTKIAASGTLKTRIKFKSASGINGVTGLSVAVIRGSTQQVFTGLTAEASGDLLYADPPTGGVAGDTVNVGVYKTGYASDYGTATLVIV